MAVYDRKTVLEAPERPPRAGWRKALDADGQPRERVAELTAHPVNGVERAKGNTVTLGGTVWSGGGALVDV